MNLIVVTQTSFEEHVICYNVIVFFFFFLLGMAGVSHSPLFL